MIDRALNIELKKGNASGYVKLYALTSARLQNYCRLFLKSDSLVEDIVQNSYVRLWEKRKSIDTEKSVENLLFTIVRNQCLNYLRDRKLAGIHFSIDEGIEPETSYFGSLPDGEATWSDLQRLYQIDFCGTEEKTLEEQLFEALNEAIGNLPERQRLILTKCKMEGKKQKEVAAEMGVSVKAIEKSLAKSKIYLREVLEARFPCFILLAFMIEKYFR